MDVLASQKLAIVNPLLKIPSLDAGERKNHRPVSNLTFMSKVIERIVAEQLVKYLQVKLVSWSLTFK